jgi:two-component system sensor kinase FixL
MANDMATQHQGFVDSYVETGRKKIIGIGREVEGKRRDGTTFPLALSVGEARAENTVRFVGLMRDLSRQKVAEEMALKHREEMMHASRLTTMGEMAAAMAHELNQPLSAIGAYTAACSRLLDDFDENRADITGALEEIGNQAYRAGDIISRMRRFTKSHELSRADVDIESMIAEIRPLAELDARANNISLELRIPEGIPTIHADAVQVQQVVLNLLRNGVDAMADNPPEHRLLVLDVESIPPGEVRVSIIDQGPGVSDEAARELFNPFFTTKETGMGMGLAISRSIVKAHGGQLDYRNNPERGATFFFALPTVQDS